MFSAAFFAAIAISLSSCMMKGEAKTQTRSGLPIVVAVMPVNNQSQDITLPVLIRYFLEEELEDEGFRIPLKFEELDKNLRQMGIRDGSQINEDNAQNVGNSLKVDGIFLSTLHNAVLNRGTKTVSASFKFISVLSGQLLWERRVDLEEDMEGIIPVIGGMSTDWTRKKAKSVAKSPAAKLPRRLVLNALKTLKR